MFAVSLVTRSVSFSILWMKTSKVYGSRNGCILDISVTVIVTTGFDPGGSKGVHVMDRFSFDTANVPSCFLYLVDARDADADMLKQNARIVASFAGVGVGDVSG